MKRRLLNLLVALSLLLFADDIHVGAKSVDSRSVYVSPRAHFTQLNSANGTVLWSYIGDAMLSISPSTFGRHAEPVSADSQPFFWSTYGFWALAGRTAFEPSHLVSFLVLRIPYWFLALVPAILLAWRTQIYVRECRRAGPGLCPHCRYDLRAHLETPGPSPGLPRPGNRCPECGTPIPHPSEARP